MKPLFKLLSIVMVAIFVCTFFACPGANLVQSNAQSSEQNINSKYYSSNNYNGFKFSYNNHQYYFTPQKAGLTKLQNKLAKLSDADKALVVDKITKMGFSLPQAINYVFAGFEEFYNNLSNKINIAPVDAMPYAQVNNCKISFKNKQNGQEIDKNALYSAFFNNLINNNHQTIQIKTETVFASYDIADVQPHYKLASTFSTNYSTSGAARKSNIYTATKAINGTIIKNGQTVSFNNLTGLRTEENGYQKAKIILGGVYTEGVGGGVCQVSTTFYNACLLAGLDIAEVHNHSLPSSYVSPCFDAMVNSGTSDLKVTNNTGYDVIVAAGCINDNCKVCIYGHKPQYKIVRRWEKYQTLPAEGDVIVTDCTDYPNITPQLGDTRISYGADGFRAKGYLDYYDGDTLVKTIKIRDNTYNPKKGVVLRLDTLP